jgi:hypothetical protein
MENGSVIDQTEAVDHGQDAPIPAVLPGVALEQWVGALAVLLVTGFFLSLWWNRYLAPTFGGRIGYVPKLQILSPHALTAAQRIFGIPDFRYYALADGIKTILSKCGQGSLPKHHHQGGLNHQLSLFLH